MRLIGTAVALVAAIMLVSAGAADAKKRHRHHARGPAAFKFCIQCPVGSPVPWTVRTCGARGKDRESARMTCQAQNNGCYIRNYSKKTCR
jgi:hypothetical protein